MSDHEISSLKESCEQSIKELDDNELITINVLNAQNQSGSQKRTTKDTQTMTSLPSRFPHPNPIRLSNLLRAELIQNQVILDAKKLIPESKNEH